MVTCFAPTIGKRAASAALVLGRAELRAVGEVAFELLLQLLRKSLVVQSRIDLVVDAEAADVDIGRADGAELGVDADRLGVQIPLSYRKTQTPIQDICIAHVSRNRVTRRPH